MASGGTQRDVKKPYTDGPLKVVPYCNAESYIKGCGKSYRNAPEGKNPQHARSQDYNPELIKDHTGGRGSKGSNQHVGTSASTDHTGSMANTRGLDNLYRRDNGGR